MFVFNEEQQMLRCAQHDRYPFQQPASLEIESRKLRTGNANTKKEASSVGPISSFQSQSLLLIRAQGARKFELAAGVRSPAQLLVYTGQEVVSRIVVGVHLQRLFQKPGSQAGVTLL